MPPKKICSDRPLKKNEIRDTLANCYKRGYSDALKIEKIASKQTTPFESVNIDVGKFLSKKPKKTASSKFTYKSSAKKQTNPYEEPDIKYESLLKTSKKTASSNFYTRKEPKKKSEEEMNVLEKLQMMMNDTDIGGDVLTNVNQQPMDIITNLNQPEVIITQAQPQSQKSIKQYVDTEKAKGRKNRVDIIATDLVPIVRPDLGGGKKIKKLYNKAQMIQMLLDSGLYERDGETIR